MLGRVVHIYFTPLHQVNKLAEANMILTVEKLDKQIIHYIFQYPDKSQLPLVLKDLHLYISD